VVQACGDKAAVRFLISEVAPLVPAEAAEACGRIEERIPRDLMIRRFLFD
jgi:hypothetical protein